MELGLVLDLGGVSGRDIQRDIGGRMVRLIDFVLEDASENQLHCTVWDAHVDQLLPHFNSTSIEPVVLLLQLCRPRELSELVGISVENLLNKYGVINTSEVTARGLKLGLSLRVMLNLLRVELGGDGGTDCDGGASLVRRRAA
nr:replication protein A 70 kDa DNA-binding subunit B-like [Ipomoea batatas]